MSEATSTPTPGSTSAPLLEQVVQLNSEYKKNPDEVLAQARALAIEQALQHLLTGETARAAFEAGVRSAAAEGKTTYRITTWNLADGLKFNGRYLLDLLNKGELLGMMQDWLDENYKTEDKQFRIFHHKVARVHNRFALVVSWDKEGFASIDEIISHNREMVGRRAAVEGGDSAPTGAPVVDTSVPRTRRFDRAPGAPRHREGGPHEEGRRPRRFDGAPTHEGDARPPRSFHPRDGDVRPREFRPREPREPREGETRPPREFRPREPREPREGETRPPREFRPHEPREPREGETRPPREFRPREPREPREGETRPPREFRPREPREGDAAAPRQRNFSNFRPRRAEE